MRYLLFLSNFHYHYQSSEDFYIGLCLFVSRYPHRDAKLQLAKDIVKTFPKLKAVCGDPHVSFYTTEQVVVIFD